MVSSLLQADAWCRRHWAVWGSTMQDSMKATKESSSRWCPLADVSRALYPCLGAVGSGTHAMHCPTLWGQPAVELLQYSVRML